MSIIDEVKQRTDISEIVGQYVRLTKAGRNLRGLCPFHTEKTPSFFIYPEQQSWHCFGACNSGGDVISFLMKKEGMEFGDALRHLADRAGVKLISGVEPEAKTKEKERLYQITQTAAQYFHQLLLDSPLGKEARAYLVKRGIKVETMSAFQLGFSPEGWRNLKQHLKGIGYSEDELLLAGLLVKPEDGETYDRFRNRLMFPVQDRRGRTIGFGARALDDSLPKYLNSPQTPLFDKSSNLYGINRAATDIRQRELAVIVEGYMDVITAHQNGYGNVVAAMGTSVTENQIRYLKKLTRHIALALDADNAGEEAMLRGVGYESLLEAEVKVIVLPQGKDPDDMIKEDSNAWETLLQSAPPITDYTFDMVAGRLDLNRVSDKSLAVNKLLPIINEIRDPVRQAHYMQKLAHMVKVNQATITAALGQLKARQPGRRTTQKQTEKTQVTLLASPVEEHFLSMVLQYPEFKSQGQSVSPDYFASSENREIFSVWQRTESLESLKEGVDDAIGEHLARLLSRKIPDNNLEQRYDDYLLSLRQKYLRNLETKRAEIFALEAESGGPGADLVKLEKEGIEPSVKLREVFTEKGRKVKSQGS